MPLSAVPAFAIAALTVGASLTGLVRTSLGGSVLTSGELTLDAWRRVLTDPAFHDAVVFTLAVTIAATVLSVAGAMAVGAALWRRSPLVRRALGLPVAAPHLVVAALAVVWLAPGGLIDRILGWLPVDVVGSGWGAGIVIVYVLKELPFLTLLALVALDDATRELDHTAAMLGASPLRRVADVVVPRVAMPMTAGGLVVAAFVIGAVEVPLVMGPTRPDMLGPYALEVVRIDGPIARADAAAANLVAATLVALLGGVAALVVARRRRR
jgi:putative spermidine/putrescine transport system permease protein